MIKVVTQKSLLRSALKVFAEKKLMRALKQHESCNKAINERTERKPGLFVSLM